jgi:hypothetical protein
LTLGLKLGRKERTWVFASSVLFVDYKTTRPSSKLELGNPGYLVRRVHRGLLRREVVVPVSCCEWSLSFLARCSLPRSPGNPTPTKDLNRPLKRKGTHLAELELQRDDILPIIAWINARSRADIATFAADACCNWCLCTLALQAFRPLTPQSFHLQSPLPVRESNNTKNLPTRKYHDSDFESIFSSLS